MAAVEALLEAEGFGFRPEPFFERARALTTEPFPLGESLAARFGFIYIQDRSSMLPPLALAPEPDERVLDMCASPGSKTSQLAGMVGPKGFVLGNEPSRDRLATLRANLTRLGLVQAATTSAPGQKLPFPAHTWNRILLDPPCSGWGTVKRHPKAATLWTDDKTAPLIALQRTLLTHAAMLLAPGGRLVYSTCTTNPEENERQTEFAREKLGLTPLPLPTLEGFVLEDGPGLDCCWRVRGETEDGGGQGQGFFIALFGKPDTGREAPPPTAEERPRVRAKGKGKRRDLPGRRLNPDRLDHAADVRFDNLPPGEIYDFNGRVFFLPAPALETMPEGLAWQGCPVGRVKNGRFRPDPGARMLLPDYGQGEQALETAREAGHVVIEDPAVLRDLLSGRSVAVDKGPSTTGLYFGSLPLGWASRKGSRLIWAGG